MSNALTLTIAALLIGLCAAVLDCSRDGADEMDRASSARELEPQE